MLTHVHKQILLAQNAARNNDLSGGKDGFD